MRRLPKIALAVAGLVGAATPAEGVDTNVHVGTQGTKFTVNGSPVNQGSSAEGALINFRAIQGVVDDYNSSTRSNWAYPNGPWNADRNTDELIAMLPTYAALGLNMITVGLQGGHPRWKCDNAGTMAGRNFSLFEMDGDLRSDGKARLARLIAAADDAGLIVSVQFFYQNSDNRLSGNAAVIHATEEATVYLRGLPQENILIEIANEVTLNNYRWSALQPAGIDDRIDQVHQLWPGSLVSVSMSGGGSYPTAVANRVDWSSVHAGSIDGVSELVGKIRNLEKLGHPVVVTEDGWDGGRAMDAAISEGAGWGLYEQGCEFEGNYNGRARYRDGFQSLPVNWGLLDPIKQAFFDDAKAWGG